MRKDEPDTHASGEIELGHDGREVVAVGAEAMQPDHGGGNGQALGPLKFYGGEVVHCRFSQIGILDLQRRLTPGSMGPYLAQRIYQIGPRIISRRATGHELQSHRSLLRQTKSLSRNRANQAAT